MARFLELTDEFSAPDSKVLTDIRTNGFHILGVFPSQDEEGPNWAFSIGLFHSFRHPEVIVCGLSLNTCMSVVSLIGNHVKTGGRYDPEVMYDDLLESPYRCTFRPVSPTQYRSHVGYALWFYDPDRFPLLQCFWTDKDVRFPWDEGCDAYVQEAQPLLFLPKAPTPGLLS
jgi:Domain of unknown function (DUF4262)